MLLTKIITDFRCLPFTVILMHLLLPAAGVWNVSCRKLTESECRVYVLREHAQVSGTCNRSQKSEQVIQQSANNWRVITPIVHSAAEALSKWMIHNARSISDYRFSIYKS